MLKILLICGTVLAIAGAHFNSITLAPVGHLLIGIALAGAVIVYVDNKFNV